MLHVANCLLIFILLCVFIQDIKHRAIHFSLPILLFGVAITKFLMLRHDLGELLITSIFLILVLFGLAAYLSIKSKKIINPLDASIGLGDILFLLAIIPLFYTTTYIVFFIIGMLFSIICHIAFNKRKSLNVPLAGYLSLFLLLGIIVNWITDKELFYTHLYI